MALCTAYVAGYVSSFHNLDAQLFRSQENVGKRHHDPTNSLLSAESLDGDEEIEDDETVTWLDNVQDGADS